MVDKNHRDGEIIKFIPPLYKQRYQFIKDLVVKHKPKKVADLGCADCSLLWMLKFCSCIEVLAGLDICENVLKEKMHRLTPLPGDYLQPSERTLTITLHQGSVVEKDSCLLGFDLITCIELIEHLESTELPKFLEAVFGFMTPAMVVISTPNAEFNPLLPGVKLFRHSNHKFEWNRTQFQNWASAAADHYGYSVEFTGLGTLPGGNKDVGFCTQIGVFMRNSTEEDEFVKHEKHAERAYKTIFTTVYPSLKDEKYLKFAVVNEVIFQAEKLKQNLMDSLKLDHYSADEEGWDEPQCRTQALERLPLFGKNMDLTKMDSPPLEEGPEPFCTGDVIYIPLAKLFSFPKVQRLCGTLENLQKLLADSEALSSDGSAVMVNTDDHSEHDWND
ncbi:small RNA 2'-O-methyltransferase isoform X1 [Ornithorhynchus anatinus]|uniref:Small RNA 2'-O-methyltransferase n=1 Tax=Ornithorhynchus anatinus TaxID=9258 RepID=F7G0W8_ORNAN|nr:small RNA 2'-O-methyltransferase isoform X1 [Ornithorhynchus anatinus]XP_028919742.1 small RNA 2'-O-methyltransferase isoform X1 [Ornithorhynchus anatinus]